jgi:hypothetical protein
MMTGTLENSALRLMMARHQDIAENEVRLELAEFRERIEAVLSQQHRMAALL